MFKKNEHIFLPKDTGSPWAASRPLYISAGRQGPARHPGGWLGGSHAEVYWSCPEAQGPQDPFHGHYPPSSWHGDPPWLAPAHIVSFSPWKIRTPRVTVDPQSPPPISRLPSRKTASLGCPSDPPKDPTRGAAKAPYWAQVQGLRGRTLRIVGWGAHPVC